MTAKANHDATTKDSSMTRMDTIGGTAARRQSPILSILSILAPFFRRVPCVAVVGYCVSRCFFHQTSAWAELAPSLSASETGSTSLP